MKIGYKALMRSAEIAGLEEEIKSEEPATESTEEVKEKGSSVMMNLLMIIASILGVVLAVGLFVMLPTFLYRWCVPIMPFLAPENAALKSLVTSAFEGILKIVILFR